MNLEFVQISVCFTELCQDLWIQEIHGNPGFQVSPQEVVGHAHHVNPS